MKATQHTRPEGLVSHTEVSRNLFCQLHGTGGIKGRGGLERLKDPGETKILQPSNKSGPTLNSRTQKHFLEAHETIASRQENSSAKPTLEAYGCNPKHNTNGAYF